MQGKGLLGDLADIGLKVYDTVSAREAEKDGLQIKRDIAAIQSTSTMEQQKYVYYAVAAVAALVFLVVLTK